MTNLGLEDFLSASALARHRTHVEELQHCLAVEIKDALQTKDWSDAVFRRKAVRQTKWQKAAALRTDICAHQLYFSSFRPYATVSDAFCKTYGSVTSFFYRVWEYAMQSDGPFVYLGTDTYGRFLLEDDIRVFDRKGVCPTLALDLCEHAYYLDFGFDRSAYIKAALQHLHVTALLKNTDQDEDFLPKSD